MFGIVAVMSAVLIWMGQCVYLIKYKADFSFSLLHFEVPDKNPYIGNESMWPLNSPERHGTFPKIVLGAGLHKKLEVLL